MKEVIQLANELGVDEVAFKTAQVYEYENGNPLIPDNIKYSRYKKNSDGTYSIKNKLLNLNYSSNQLSLNNVILKATSLFSKSKTSLKEAFFSLGIVLKK